MLKTAEWTRRRSRLFQLLTRTVWRLQEAGRDKSGSTPVRSTVPTTETLAKLSVNVLIIVQLDREEAEKTRLSPSLLRSLLQADSIIGRLYHFYIYVYIYKIYSHIFDILSNIF